MLSHLVKSPIVRLDVVDAVEIHLFISFALLFSFVHLSLLNSVYIRSHLILTVEWVEEKVILQVEQVLDKSRLQYMSLGVVELTFTMHCSHLPSADVGVSDLFLGYVWRNSLRPDKLSVAMELTKVEISFVLTTVSVDEVTVAVPCTVPPATRVFLDLVSLYLNSISMSHCHQSGHEIFAD